MNMTHENLPATKLVATHCCVCGHSLVEADSVETGIGPVCSKRYKVGHFSHPPDVEGAAGFLTGTGVGVNLEDPHKAANQLIYILSADQDSPHVSNLCMALEALGYTEVARIIAARLAPAYVSVRSENGGLVVKFKSKSDGTFDKLVTAFRSVPGRAWDKKTKTNSFPVASKGALWKALVKALPKGSIVDGTSFKAL